jgi:hypothetical protein
MNEWERAKLQILFQYKVDPMEYCIKENDETLYHYLTLYLTDHYFFPTS